MTPAAPAAPGGPRHLLVRANSLRLPVKDGSVHSVICSPPYLGLRDYGLPPSSWPGITFAPMVGVPPVTVPPMTCCLGLEPSIHAYVGHLVLIAKEVWRCLHPSGSFWVNIGDSYSDATKHHERRRKDAGDVERPKEAKSCERCGQDFVGGIGRRFCSSFCGGMDNSWRSRRPVALKAGDLVGVPWRVAYALQADGWILRAAPPWIKPGLAMPESCTSRPNVSHEYIFMLTKAINYYFDMDACRRSSAPATLERDRYSRVVQAGSKSHIPDGAEGQYGVQHDHETVSHPGGRHWRTSDLFMDSLDSAIAYHADRLADLEAARAKGGLLGAEGGEDLPGAFLVNPQSYAGSHYAAWPTKLVADMVKASTSEAGVCGGCGSPWERVTEREESSAVQTDSQRYLAVAQVVRTGGIRGGGTNSTTIGVEAKNMPRRVTLGWRPTCSCPEGTPVNRATILDPFGGSGTTAQVATSLGRNAISVDLSSEYHGLARDRVERPHAPRPRHRGRPAATPLFPEGIDEIDLD